MDTKPNCKLIGTDGNVFAIIAKVGATLKGAGQKDNANEFVEKAMSASSYDEVLSMLSDYVNVTGEEEDLDDDDGYEDEDDPCAHCDIEDCDNCDEEM